MKSGVFEPRPGSEASPSSPSELGSGEVLLGCLNFGRWGRLGQREVDAIVGEAIDLGIAGFDTAAAYGAGESETMLGRALRGRNTPILLSTKIFGPAGSNEPKDWRQATLSGLIDDSLRRLDADCVDVLSIHRLDDGLPIEPVLTTMAGAQAAGKAQKLGTSSMSGDLLLEALTVADFLELEISIEQCKLSILDRSAEASVLPVADRRRVRTSHYGVLEEGLLAGGVNNRRYQHAIEVQPWPAAARRSLVEKQRVASQLASLAADFGVSLVQLAVAFAALPRQVEGVLQYPTMILGVGRIGQLAAPLAGLRSELPDDLLAAIDDLVPPGTAVGIPDRSRMRVAALARSATPVSALFSGDPLDLQRDRGSRRARKSHHERG